MLASGRVDEAETALKNVVRLNRVENVDLEAMFTEYRKSNGLGTGSALDQSRVSRPTYGDLFRGPRMRVRTISVLLML